SVSDSMSMLTQARATSGTLVYMSPQQLDGKRATPLDDIYSLGATLYELLTSKPPFFSGAIEHQIRTISAPSMTERRAELGVTGSAIPLAWERTVSACLAKDPKQRPQNAADIASRLSLSAGRLPQLSEVVGKTALDPEHARNKEPQTLARLLVGAVIVLVLITAVYFTFRGHLRSQIRPQAPALAAQGSPQVAAPSLAPTVSRAEMQPSVAPTASAAASSFVLTTEKLPQSETSRDAERV